MGDSDALESVTVKRPEGRAPGILAASFLATTLALGCFIAGCGKKAPTPLDQSPVSTQLKHFISEKKAQATAAAAADKLEMLPEFKTIFAAADRGDWETISNAFDDLRRLEYSQRLATTTSSGSAMGELLGKLRARISGKAAEDAKAERLHGTQWEDVREIWGAFNCLASDVQLDKYSVALGQEIIRSIPPDSIYFGGSDPGRWTVTALQTSQVNGDPFFTLSQNAMIDPLYLDYLQKMYGARIYIPTANDSQKCFQDYMEDAQRRIIHDQNSPSEPKQVKPGEDVKIDGSGRIQVTGQVAVMSINAEFVKVIFDRETNREFYVEESYPLDWMYPRLEPHGLIMKVNREPMAELPEDVIRKDHEFWAKEVAPVIGDWLKDDTSVLEICAFAERIYLRHDSGGFKGDPRLVRGTDDWPAWMAKLRSSIAGIYMWRIGRNPSGAIMPAEYLAKGEASDRITKEADFALRQAFALCPASPEVGYRYVQFLVDHKRNAEALAVAETGLALQKGKPEAESFQKLVDALKPYSNQGSQFILPPELINK